MDKMNMIPQRNAGRAGLALRRDAATRPISRASASGARRAVIIVACVLTAFVLTACAGSGPRTYKDGTYTARSSVWEDAEDGNGNGYGEVTITIEGGKISQVVFETYEPDGTLKDEDYGKTAGKITNQDFYNKAQRAVVASHGYAEQLSATGELDGVDTVSGATISYNEFQEAVQNALDQAAE
ncbi:MAG: FMN-binding protein [Atopobiaceae bacterium]|nr:FMN-binding protein [Atopobiaceae bacterium]